MIKKALKITAFVLLGLVVILGGVAGVTQTQFFRDWLRDWVLAQVDSLLVASVYIGPIHGNLVSGFSVDSVAIAVDGESFLSSRRVNIQYNLFQIPGRTISIRSLAFIRPDIRLLRDRGGSWNFKRMIRPVPGDTSASSPFDWTIDLKSLRIEEGHFTLVDSASLLSDHDPVRDPYYWEYHDIALRDLSLDLSASLTKETKILSVASLVFVSERPDFQLKKLSADITISRSGASVDNLVIRTARTDLSISCGMREIDLLEGIDPTHMRDKPVRVHLHANAFDLDEFKRFLSPLSFLHGPVGLRLSASGTYGDLKIDSLALGFGKTSIHLQGKVANLHDPGNLFLDAHLIDGRIDPADPLALLPDFRLPNLQAVGPSILFLDFRGHPLEFVSRFSLQTAAAGTIESKNFALTIGGPQRLRYVGDCVLRGVDLGAVLNDTLFRSNLSGRADIEGEGVALETIRGTLTLQFDSSEFRGLPLTPSRLTVEAAAGKIATAGRLTLGTMEASLTAELNGGETSEPRFAVDGDVTSLNLAELLRDPRYDSDLTMAMKVRGSGVSLPRLSLEAFLDIHSSRYGKYTLDSTTAHVVLDQHDPGRRTLEIQSGVADLSIKCAYDLDQLVSVVTFEARNISRAISHRFAVFDSAGRTLNLRHVQRPTPRRLPAGPPVDAEFSLTVKNLEPVSLVTGMKSFDGIGVLRGWVRGDEDDFSFQTDLDAYEFFYGSVESGVLLQGGKLTVAGDHITRSSPLEDAQFHVELDAQEININRTRLDSVNLKLSYRAQQATYSAHTTLDRKFGFDAQGAVELMGDSVRFALGKLNCLYRTLLWSADPGAGLLITPGGFHATNITLRRNDESIRMEAAIRNGGGLDAHLEANRIDLDHLKYLLSSSELGSHRTAFAGTGSVMVMAKGTLELPEYTASVAAENITFRSAPIGQLKGEFAYRDSLLNVSVHVHNAGDAQSPGSDLMVVGELPLNLALVGMGERISGRPVRLRVHSTGFQMSVLDPVLPTINDLAGILQCDVSVLGTLRKPAYEGSFTVSDCVFLFVPNNIYYSFQGRFQTQGERIRVLSATAANLPSDVRGERKGELTVTGDFLLTDLVPGDFNLAGRGSLLVVKETTRRSSLSVYGNLFVEIGPGGLSFTGSLDKSLLKGDVLVRNSSLVFPPTQAPISVERALSVPVVIVDDTTRKVDSRHPSAAARYFGQPGSGGAEGSREDSLSRSFLDGLRYDLDVETSGGNTEIRMVFNPISGEELVANINGKFSITEDGKRWFGDLVVDRAYYNFLKRFNAEGRIRFTGDFQNPELDITAEYRGSRTVKDSVGERTERVTVKFLIKGNRYEPKVDYGLIIDDVDYANYRGPKSNDIQSDALQFIVYGSFPLTAAERNDIPSDIQKRVGASILTGATSLLTGALSEFLRDQTGFIKSVEFQYGARGSLTESADIRLSGVAWNGYWRYGGTILNDPLANANFSLLYSFDTILRDPALRNLMIEFERRVETVSTGQKSDLKRINSARLFYRISF